MKVASAFDMLKQATCMCLGSSRPSGYACDFANCGHTFTQFLGDLAKSNSMSWQRERVKLNPGGFAPASRVRSRNGSI